MKYSVCIEALYGKNFLVGLQEIKGLGIDAFEFWSWWDKDVEQIAAEKERLGLTVAAICTKFISIVDPSQHDQYLAGLKESIAAAKKLGCKTLISQVGSDTGKPRPQQHAALREGAKRAVPMLEENGITLVLEPLNTKVDHPEYYLSSSQEAFEIVREIGSERVKILFDIYHQQITEGDVLRNICDNLPLIGHFHAAGNPGRHELDTGELNYSNIFREVQERGFQKYFGLEYFPLRRARDGLEKLPR